MWLCVRIAIYILQAPPESSTPAKGKQPSQPIAPKQVSPQNQVQHIMISYNWGVQSTVKKLAATLKAAGYQVWLDIEQMKGDTLEASKYPDRYIH